VLKLINPAHAKGISVIFITHNINHAYPVGDTFTLLNGGRWLGTSRRARWPRTARDMMAGGAETQNPMAELEGVTI
jgi:simple sugar transport system ATP-binding protein